ncbi:nuclear transport factor 2 family protein [Pantoea sp. At-9b]|uniref:nuclear transport factor 2 family protein n=1 Tax=Pantoea sp. (strain At-9b) TaxID=592316 RepID=UPI0001B3E4AD|nr:nuclear transport factor 2 family protein [Pantoea sp. At-9b]ADU72646.1 conserved hypothetical protein [Pantoea sp. At-9b]
MKTHRQIVVDALTEIVSNPIHDEVKIASYFSPAYQQYVDGKHMDYRDFIKHMAVLKTLTHQMQVTMLSIVSEGNRVCTHHRVKVEKHNGARSEVEVMAHFTLAADRIVRCDELTRQISGDKRDHDLGSRI